MKIVEPKVYLLASTAIDLHHATGLYPWLTDLNGKDVMKHLTGSEAEMLVELAGRRCYKSFAPGLNPNVTKIRKDSEEYHLNILKSRHGSVLEHATATFAFENVSRVFTHELVRHRVGTAFSQESLRYVRLDDLAFWIPPEIAENPEALQVFVETVEFLEKQQKRLAEIFQIDKMANFAEKKKLTSAFRRIAPEGLATGIVMTFNMRALRHFIELRSSEHAEVEIRIVADKVAAIAEEQWPFLFQDFVKQPSDTEYAEWKPEYSKI